MSLQSETIDQIIPALIKARGEFKAAVKDAKNEAFKKKDGSYSAYTTLDSVIEAITQALLANGVLYTHQTDIMDARTVLHTRFLHISGQWIGSVYPVHPVKNDPQGEGSALTYARRYSLMALAGIAPEDDDGNAATKAAQRDNKAPGRPLDGVWERMDKDEQEFLSKIAKEATEIVASGDHEAGHDYIQSQNLETDEKAALWTQLDSKTRSAIKKADAAIKERNKEQQ